jgi:hypothetical protein
VGVTPERFTGTIVDSGPDLWITYGSAPLLVRWLPPVRRFGNVPVELGPSSLDLRPDPQVGAFSVAVCTFGAVLSALAPALAATSHDLSLALKIGVSDQRHKCFQSVPDSLAITSRFSLSTRTSTATTGDINGSMNFVAPGHFEMMGIRLLTDRELEEGDRLEERKVANVGPSVRLQIFRT